MIKTTSRNDHKIPRQTQKMSGNPKITKDCSSFVSGEDRR